MAVALKLSGRSRTSVTQSETGEPATTARTVTMPGGAAARVDTSRASSASASTRQVRGGASVRSSISTVPPPTATRPSGAERAGAAGAAGGAPAPPRGGDRGRGEHPAARQRDERDGREGDETE